MSVAKPCDASLVVLDFDGTLTDADAHAPAFHAASAREIARLLAWDDATLRREWSRALAAVTALPEDAAWVVDGRGVCPARVDPYVIANSVTHRLLAEHRPGLTGDALVAEVLAIHHAAYHGVPPPFRPDARRVLEALVGSGRAVRVVSNSRTQAIERLLDSLASPVRDRVVVRGNAGKFSVCATAVPDARFEALPETVDGWDGGRPILLRRGRYFDVLRAMWDETGAGPASTLVVGDVFELDLAMPAALGAHVHLVTRAGTMPHEQRLAQAHARGDAGAPLAAALERLA